MKPALQDAVLRLIKHKHAQVTLMQRELDTLRSLLTSPGAGNAAQADPGVVLMLYLDMRSAQQVANFCNQQGWRMPGVRGLRMYSPVDVYELVRSDVVVVDPTLRGMARAKLEGARADKPTRATQWA